jgi:hypothetical protein
MPLQGQDQRERTPRFEEVLRTAISSMLLDVQTCMPVQIVSFDPLTMTATAQPVLNAKVLSDTTGLWIDVQRAVMIHCPVVFLGGGGFTTTYPIAKGDEALAIFSHRSIDEWWVAGGIQSRASLRSHSIEDGFLLVGVRSRPNVIPGISTTAAEMRSDDGTTKISVGPGGVVTITAPGGLAITGNTVGTGTVSGSELATSQIPVVSSTASNHSVPITLNGVVYYVRLSSTP